jgi:hypothetical protein
MSLTLLLAGPGTEVITSFASFPRKDAFSKSAGGPHLAVTPRECPEIGGLAMRPLRPVRRFAGWGIVDGVGLAVGWNGDGWPVPQCRRNGDQPAR